MSYDYAIETLKKISGRCSKKHMNEANTRFHIIDEIIEDVFEWPKSDITLEEHNNEGYSDYILKNKEKPILVIEAKKEKVFFELATFRTVVNRKIKLNLLMQHKPLKDAVEQVQKYANEIGCKYAVVSNGHEWIFFKQNLDGKSWREGTAFIIIDLEDYIDNFSMITKYFSYNKITKEYSLNNLFNESFYAAGERFTPSQQLNALKDTINNNKLHKDLSRYFERYFGPINITDIELMNACYVQDLGYMLKLDELTEIFVDSISPYFEEQQIEALSNGDINQFVQKVEDTIIKDKKNKVIILLGGTGSGKTTFLTNLFFNSKNKIFAEKAKIVYINLLDIAHNHDSVHTEIYLQLKRELDDNILTSDADTLLRELFSDRYEIALKQTLNGFDKQSEKFYEKRSELLTQYLADDDYVVTRLANYWKRKRRAVIITIDNTDQYNQEIQDYCFSLAKHFSKKLMCSTILSLREERFVSSSIKGYLDAFEQNAYYIQAPNPSEVFLKRIDFIEKKIEKDNLANISEIKKFFSIIRNNLNNPDSIFSKFFTATAHGNIRHAMDLFKHYISSGYTQVDEMIGNPDWLISTHQVIKPIMIPRNRFYEETRSKTMPNLFQLRDSNNSSHFTAYRILQELQKYGNIHSSIHILEGHFSSIFNMQNDFIENIKILFKFGMIESENGIDKYNEHVENIKVTSFGHYMYEILFKNISYLELVCTDCQLTNQKTSNELVSLSNKESELFTKSKNIFDKNEQNKVRFERVQLRNRKVEIFLEYLEEQEKNEHLFFALEYTPDIIVNIKTKVEKSLKEVELKAMKTLKITTKQDLNRQGIAKLD